MSETKRNQSKAEPGDRNENGNGNWELHWEKSIVKLTCNTFMFFVSNKIHLKVILTKFINKENVLKCI